MVAKSIPTKADFCLEIQYEKISENPSRVFRTMSELIETMQYFDQALVKSIDSQIEPVMLLEDIETGSIKAWLAELIKRIPDEAAYNLDRKPIVGQYLVKAKRFIISWCEGKTTIIDVKQITSLKEQLITLARETNIRMLPDYQEITNRELLTGIQRISENTSHLGKNDKASYYTSDLDKVNFNLDLFVTPENIEELLAKETIKSESEMIVKVKKPDYLGESKWECKHGKSHINVTIADKEWLKRFQNREILVQPQDSLRGRVQIENIYDESNELVDTHYTMVQVLDVIPDSIYSYSINLTNSQ
jgi:hypothetical protein